MSDTFRFWVHGTAVIPEFTKEYTGDDRGLFLRRAGWGALVRQRPGTNNWFHLAVPSATRLDDDKVDYRAVWLRFSINTGAVIKRIHVRHNNENGESPAIWRNDRLSISGQNTQFPINVENRRCTGPLVISVFVHFEAEDGQVIFAGAGGHFEEWT